MEERKISSPPAIKEKKKGPTASLSTIDGPSHGGISYRTLFLHSCSNDASFLQRVESLDHVVSALERRVPIESATSPKVITASRRHSSAGFTPSDWEMHCKPAEFVLEEVEQKGSLVQRVSELEKRVWKLQQLLSPKLSGHILHTADISSVSSAAPPDHEQGIDVEKHIEVIPSQPEITDPQNKGRNQHIADSKGSSSTFQSLARDETLVQRQLEKRSGRVKKWLAKRLHMPFPVAARQAEAH